MTPYEAVPPTVFYMWMDKDDNPVTGTRHRSVLTAIKWKQQVYARNIPESELQKKASAVKLMKGRVVLEELTDQERQDVQAVIRLHGAS